MKTCIVWDWNGTLLDDVSLAIESRNKVFPKYGLPILTDAEEYREIFCFPVKKYYLSSGINESDYDEVAYKWFEEYSTNFSKATLRDSALDTLTWIQKKGINQIVVSASEVEILNKQLEHFQVRQYFDDVLGLQDIHASDKVFLAKEYFIEKKFDRIFVVGDTSHDYDVAKAIGATMVFITQGHESSQKLASFNQLMIETLSELMKVV